MLQIHPQARTTPAERGYWERARMTIQLQSDTSEFLGILVWGKAPQLSATEHCLIRFNLLRIDIANPRQLKTAVAQLPEPGPLLAH